VLKFEASRRPSTATRDPAVGHGGGQGKDRDDDNAYISLAGAAHKEAVRTVLSILDFGASVYTQRLPRF
jgi:hypothetical protein